jgi:hypothetical protein
VAHNATGMTTRTRRGTPPRWQVALVVVAIFGLIGFTAVKTNALGAADRLDRLASRVEVFLDPPPDRAVQETVVVTPRPSATASATPAALAGGPGDVGPGELGSATRVTPTPAPAREPVNVQLVADHGAVFASQITTDDCAVAGTQMVLAILGLGNTSDAFQQEIKSRIGEWESVHDSLNGGWGPNAVREALEAYGADGYEERAYWSYTDALRDSAIAISEMGKPVVMFPWWGAHTWVMTGYQADADPTVFDDAHVSGAYILDPWHPRTSSIWGPSDPPGTFETLAELERNWPAFQGPPGHVSIGPGWSRPEGAYPDRDGRFVVLIPTTPRDSGETATGS